MVLRAIILPAILVLSSIDTGLTCCDEPLPEICVQYQSKKDAAINTDDWARLEKEARTYTGFCDGRDDPKGVANGYADLSMTLRKLNRVDEAFVAAGMGILSFQKEPGPHLEKARVLIAQRKYKEAEKELHIAESMAKKSIEEIDRNLKTPIYPPRQPNDPGNEMFKRERLRYQSSLKSVMECKATLRSKRKR